MQWTIVLSTCATMKEATKISRDLVKRRLAACVNIAPITSCYRWKGRIRMESEHLLTIKTTSAVFDRLKRRILELHSYELPEIVSVRIDKGLKPYTAWIDNETRGPA
jgi:periplasmic divalent cation tolerance protein